MPARKRSTTEKTVPAFSEVTVRVEKRVRIDVQELLGIVEDQLQDEGQIDLDYGATIYLDPHEFTEVIS